MKLLTRKSVGAAFFSFILASSFAWAEKLAADAEVFSDSGIYGPPYASIVAELGELAIQYPGWVDRYQYGTSLQGRPLVAVRISKKSKRAAGTAKLGVLIAGSIHGNEYLNIEDRLPRWLLEHGVNKPEIRRYFDQGGVVLIAPILNPDGYEARNRENAHSVDLNRDFTVRKKDYFGFKEPETKALSEWVADQVKDTGVRLALTMDYHCCIGAVLRPWSFKAPNPPRADVERFDVVGALLKETFGNRYKYGTTPVILGYEAVGTSKDYYYETYGAVGLTFEGIRKQEQKRFPEHAIMWERILTAANNGKL